jgi:hypothetical protein
MKKKEKIRKLKKTFLQKKQKKRKKGKVRKKKEGKKKTVNYCCNPQCFVCGGNSKSPTRFRGFC